MPSLETAVLAVKAAMAAATDKRSRTAVLSVAAAVILPFILVVVMILNLLDGTTSHNISAVDLAFHGGTISNDVPEDYRQYIEDIRQSFSYLDRLIEGVEDLEDGEIDGNRVKSFFYALYFGVDQPSRRAQREFLDCFLREEERVRTVENEDGTTMEETYVATVFLTDLNEIYTNLAEYLGQPLTEENRANAQRIYTLAVYGMAEPGERIAGEAMGDGSFEALLSEAEKFIGYPYVWGGSSPETSFDCSGYICWIYTHSGVYHLSRTSANGIFNQCAVVSREEAKPGDLIFFTRTYASAGAVSHVGLYLGGNRMLHCGGDGVSYGNVNSSFWRSHFYAFGRLS